MSMSAQHRDWLARGGQWRLCSPGIVLRDVLRAAGYTVYDLGNEDHLDHQPPEDHTPYSETNWPGGQLYGTVMAIDIMPPPRGSGLPSLQTLGARLHADKVSGRYPPIKYMNWGPTSDASAVQCRWKPDHVQGSSSDSGHIHISFRTDYAAYAVSYNPLGDEMEQVDKVTGYASKGNTIGDVFADLSNKREWEYVKPGATTNNPPPAGSRAVLMFEATQQIPALTAKVDVIAAKLDAIQAGTIPPEVLSAALLGALKDPTVVAALTAIAEAGANKAEDS